LRGGNTRVLVGESVAVSLGDGVVVALAVVLTVVGSVAAVKWLVVVCAVSSHWRVVLADDIGSEEVAWLVGTVSWVLAVVGSLGLARSSALRWVVWSREHVHTEVRVNTVDRERGLDGTTETITRSVEVGVAWWG